MKAAFIPVLTALLGLAAATSEKRQPGVQCVADGPPLDNPDGCKALVENLKGQTGWDATLRIRGKGRDGLWSCGHGCGLAVYPKYGDIIINKSELADDIHQIINQCAGTGPFVGTFTEVSGDLARRTEVYSNEAACNAAKP